MVQHNPIMILLKYSSTYDIVCENASREHDDERERRIKPALSLIPSHD